MAVYRFLEDAFIGGLYYQAGTNASTADVGGTLPINWVPNGNVDPIDTAAFNAMQAAGPQSQGPIITQFSAFPVAPPNTRWVQNPVTGNFTLVQGTPPYVLRPLFFNGKTWLVSFGPLGTLNIPKVTFAGWFNTTNWDRPSTIWVTDPAGNNSPYLKIPGPSVFIGYQFALFDQGGNQTSNPILFFSTDGTTWTRANNEVSGFLELQNPSSILYENGMWMAQFGFTYKIDHATHFAKDVVVQSFDGQNWTVAMEANEQISVTVTVNWDSANNRWILANGGNTKFINNPNTPNSLFGNFISAPFPKANSDLANILPGSFSAVRFNMNAGVCVGVDLTTTTITDAIRNSGTGWPAAAWTNVFSFDPTCASGPTLALFFGAPSPPAPVVA